MKPHSPAYNRVSTAVAPSHDVNHSPLTPRDVWGGVALAILLPFAALIVWRRFTAALGYRRVKVVR